MSPRPCSWRSSWARPTRSRRTPWRSSTTATATSTGSDPTLPTWPSVLPRSLFVLNLAASEVWFVTGSQHLYGPETLATVAEHATAIAAALDDYAAIPVRIVPRPVLTGSDGILALVRE